MLHNIELSDKCDMYKAWQMINEIRDLRKKRRNIKDEKLVLSGIKSQGITYLNRKSVQKCVDGLSNRKYKIRIVEELSALSNQKVSALVRQLVESGDVVKTTDKKKSIFSLAESEVEGE